MPVKRNASPKKSSSSTIGCELDTPVNLRATIKLQTMINSSHSRQLVSWVSSHLGGFNAAVLAGALLVTGCGTPQVMPFMRPPAAPRGVTAESNLVAAREAWQILANPSQRAEWPAARLAYNQALAASFDDLRRAELDWNRAAATIGTRWETVTPGALDPCRLGSVFPASLVKVSRLGERQRLEGVGLPLVGWIDDSSELYRDFAQAPPSGVAVNVTVVLRFDRGTVPTWELIRPYRRESVSCGGVGHPLAGDFSAAHALYWKMSWLDTHKLANVLRPDRIEGVEGLFFAQSLDRDRIPVVFVHGFNSSPDAFAPMVNELMGEAWFRRNYQVWFFSYPTGVPWMLSAGRFRSHFNAASEFARSHGVRNVDRTVVIGHSMGGLITQASLREPGNTVYEGFASKPPEQLDLRPDERQLVHELFLWKPLPQVQRAVFLATPHRGSPTADTWYSMLASTLIQLPKTLTVDLADSLLRNATAITDPMVLTPEERLEYRQRGIRIPTGIGSLSPERPGIKVLQQLPFRRGVHLHSVIGDRGRGDGATSSDGVVPYWSSNLPEAESECVVPSDHGVPRNPQAITEVKRILQLHLKETK